MAQRKLKIRDLTLRDGQQSLFATRLEGTLLMPSPDKSVIGVTPAIVGSVEANEVLKLICGYGEPLAGKLWTIDLRTMQSYILSL